MHNKNRIQPKKVGIVGTIFGGLLIGISAIPLVASAQGSQVLNPCPRIYYEEPFNSTRLAPEGCPPNYVDYEGKPAIIAQSIAPAPEPGEITSNPKQYYGRTLAVTGEVEEILSPTTFTLDEDQLFGASDLLVLVANPKTGNTANTAVKEDQTVAVTGVLRPLVVADLEREYDFNWDEGFVKQLEAEYSQKPVLVVQSVYQSAIPRAAK
ncbi:hypothetical protein [Scytonema millei]|uniref:Uncharacterized protein n=1 Tax=Scytonema millei VB511283 TaxID=1245923 RepID=A0A9X5E8H3_9CYAN|nr:hypothetical protein [Scytonema millei]NHC35982.1 hypothetical protein [Scytonema millei VB511283]